MEANITRTDIIKQTADAQDAHEAIRPTYIDIKPEHNKRFFN